jgi:hypothetical protein
MNINTITPFVVIFLLSCSAIARTMDILNENKTINIQSNNIVIENLNAVTTLTTKNGRNLLLTESIRI